MIAIENIISVRDSLICVVSIPIVKAKNYLAIISNILKVDSAWLFGSYASNSARDDSDIDIGIFAKKIDEEYFLL